MIKSEDDEKEMVYRSDSTVELIDYMGGDNSIVMAARVSTGPNEEATFYDLFTETAEGRRLRNTVQAVKEKGLIGYLMREKHGSPFEHNSMTFRIETQIFTAREHMRHRVGFSYNERSGRYSDLLPYFWIPGEDRGLQNAGKPSKPELVEGTYAQKRKVPTLMKLAYKASWRAYKVMLRLGVANEVARAVLPVGIYTEYYVTMNLRSALNFISLRVQDENAAHVSRPQKEIQEVALKIEETVAKLFPVAYEQFVANKRVAP